MAGGKPRAPGGLTLNLIHLFNFYLAVMFLLSTWRRLGQYRAVVGIALSAPGRWPRTLHAMKRHGALFFTWSTLRPAAVALSLLAVNAVASRLIWPLASLTPHDLLDHWPYLPFVAFTAVAMLGIDGYFLLRVGTIDRAETEKYLDEAEYWLKSWAAPVVKVLTFGRINPRMMVDVEVQKAMAGATDLLNKSLWWISLQTGCRVAFGLTLWLTWALNRE